MSDWQPISTAPTKGDYLLWYPPHDMGRYKLPARITMAGHGGGARVATHWMPFPDPPETAP